MLVGRRVRTKGWSGQVIEHELGVATGGARGPDFEALGIELKTVPVTPVAAARIDGGLPIDPIAIAGESWETSYAREAGARVLFVAEVSRPARARWATGASRPCGWRRRPTRKRCCAPTSSCSCASTGPRDAPPRSPVTSARRCRSDPKGAMRADLRAAYDAGGPAHARRQAGFYLRPAFVARILAGTCELGYLRALKGDKMNRKWLARLVIVLAGVYLIGCGDGDGGGTGKGGGGGGAGRGGSSGTTGGAGRGGTTGTAGSVGTAARAASRQRRRRHDGHRR